MSDQKSELTRTEKHLLIRLELMPDGGERVVAEWHRQRNNRPVAPPRGWAAAYVEAVSVAGGEPSGESTWPARAPAAMETLYKHVEGADIKSLFAKQATAVVTSFPVPEAADCLLDSGAPPIGVEPEAVVDEKEEMERFFFRR